MELLKAMSRGEDGAADALFPLVYAELRRLADGLLRGGAGHTLQPTAVVHEAYLKLADDRRDLRGQEHFLALASRAMRQVLVDHARKKGSGKRCGEWERVTLSASPEHGPETSEVSLIELEQALVELEAESGRRARVVELRYFGGLGVPEVARVLGVSERTVKSEWRYARAWLRVRLLEDE